MPSYAILSQAKENEMRNAVLIEKQRREQYQRMVPWRSLCWNHSEWSHCGSSLSTLSQSDDRSQAEAVLFLQEEGRQYMARVEQRKAMKGKKGKKGNSKKHGNLDIGDIGMLF